VGFGAIVRAEAGDEVGWGGLEQKSMMRKVGQKQAVPFGKARNALPSSLTGGNE
jgi:hypothetical protein